MCTTEYIKERAQEIERAAQDKINIIDDVIAGLLPHITRAEALHRGGGLLVLLLRMQAEFIEEKAAALRVIESALDLRRSTKEVL